MRCAVFAVMSKDVRGHRVIPKDFSATPKDKTGIGVRGGSDLRTPGQGGLVGSANRGFGGGGNTRNTDLSV